MRTVRESKDKGRSTGRKKEHDGKTKGGISRKSDMGTTRGRGVGGR